MRFSAAMTAERVLPGFLAERARPLGERLDAALFARDEQGQAGRMSLAAFVIRVVSAVITFASQVFLARWMGAFDYGVFVLVWVTMTIVGNLSCLGFHTSVIRFVPEYREKRLLPELRGILLTSRLLALLVAAGVAGLGALGLHVFGDAIESYYVLPFYLGLTCLPMIALSDVLQGIARANSWALSALVPAYVLRPALIIVAMAAALALGYEPSAETAVLCAIIATYATAIVQLVGVTALADRDVPAGPLKLPFRSWTAVSLPIFLIEGFLFLLHNADVLMVGFFMSPHEVAVYFATAKTLSLVHFVYFAVKAGAAQRYAQFTHGEPERLAGFARETVAWTFWPSLAMAVVVLVLGKPMLALFGPGFDAGYPLLLPLVAGVVARAAVGPAESLLTMSGHQNVCAAIFAATLALSVGLNLVLIPALGLWGAAIATALAMGFEAAALSFTAWRKLGIAMAVFIR